MLSYLTDRAGIATRLLWASGQNLTDQYALCGQCNDRLVVMMPILTYF